MLFYVLPATEKESAEAQVSNLKLDFRSQDPDKRLRVTAIIEKTISEAKRNVNKRLFAKHLMNSRKDVSTITDSAKERVKNK